MSHPRSSWKGIKVDYQNLFSESHKSLTSITIFQRYEHCICYFDTTSTALSCGLGFRMSSPERFHLMVSIMSSGFFAMKNSPLNVKYKRRIKIADLSNYYDLFKLKSRLWPSKSESAYNNAHRKWNSSGPKRVQCNCASAAHCERFLSLVFPKKYIFLETTNPNSC